MLTAKTGSNDKLYGVYYTVFAFLAGEERLIKNYFCCRPYTQMQAAASKVAELKISHQDDDSYVVKRYK